MGGNRLWFVFACALGLQAAHAQAPNPVQIRTQLFGQEIYIDNAMARARALPPGQINTVGTDVFQSLETTRDIFTFTPLKVSFPTTFEACRLAQASNRHLNGIRTAFLCDSPQTLGFINFIATREETALTQDAFVDYAENDLRNEAIQIFGISGDHRFCKPRTPAGRLRRPIEKSLPGRAVSSSHRRQVVQERSAKRRFPVSTASPLC